MGSPFAAAIAAAAVTSDAVMGERFELRPTKRPDKNGRVVTDNSRAVVQFTGIYGEPFARADSGPVMRVGVKAERAGHASDRPFVSVRLSQFADRPRDGDRIVRLSDSVAFTVAEILPDGQGLARLDLNRAG